MICIRIRSSCSSQEPEPGAGDLQRVPFPAATGAELGHQSGRKDKQTDKQPQAAGTGRIRAAAAGSSAGIREPGAGDQRQRPGDLQPQAAGSGARNREQLQRDPSADDLHQDPEPGAGTGCSGILCRDPGAAAAARAAGRSAAGAGLDRKRTKRNRVLYRLYKPFSIEK